jgi:hypothetical protein
MKVQTGDFIQYFNSYFDIENNIYDIVVIKKKLGVNNAVGKFDARVCGDYCTMSATKYCYINCEHSAGDKKLYY